MRINSLHVRNFRAITGLSLTGLRETVVVAGPNGCGKSCVFDAIRLFKSAYGGYQPNEWHHWLGEFHINVNRQSAGLLSLFQNPAQPLLVAAEIELSSQEIEYLRAHLEKILAEQTWRELVPELSDWKHVGASPLAANLRVHADRVRRRVAQQLPVLGRELESRLHIGEVEISPDGDGRTRPSRVLELVFGRYDPQNVGIIDYHGPARNYARENLGGINLSIETSEEKMRQHALYNYSGKYGNLKTEMASSFIRQLLASRAEDAAPADESLSDTLRELFATFFPGKEFLGPLPTSDGKLLFPVRTPSGAEHDIDELSSGEKEVLYGYLRLRNAAPKGSVLLIDEPELHLNPRLVNGLATFYHRHLGKPLGTQLWLVTHSDTLIREAVGQEGFSVFHLQPPGQYDGDNQASKIEVSEDLDRLVIELVGDLAAYRPGAKIVVFEGGGEAGFDVRMTCALFPGFQQRTNPISGGSKARVTQLYRLLEEALLAGHLHAKFYAITDSDNETSPVLDAPRFFSWGAYHVENYLLEPRFLLMVLQELNRAAGPLASDEGVLRALLESARDTVGGLVAHRLRMEVNQQLLGCLDLKFDPKEQKIGLSLAEAVKRSQERLRKLIKDEAGEEYLLQRESELRGELESDLINGRWLSTFRGRDIIKRFVGKYVAGVNYQVFRDLTVARMRDAGYQPEGMKSVIVDILND